MAIETVTKTAPRSTKSAVATLIERIGPDGIRESDDPDSPQYFLFAGHPTRPTVLFLRKGLPDAVREQAAEWALGVLTHQSEVAS